MKKIHPHTPFWRSSVFFSVIDALFSSQSSSSRGLSSRLKRVARHEIGIITKAWKGMKNPKWQADFRAQSEGKGRLEFRKGIPFLFVSGSPYERGFQHGKILASQIQHLQGHYLSLLMDTEKKRKKAMEFILLMEPYIPPVYAEEMRGMADGCGMTYEEVLFGHTFIDLFHTQLVACSTVGISPHRSATGQTLFGRNLDFPSLGFVHHFSMVLVMEQENKPPIVSITWPGMIGIYSGMNPSGLSLGMLSIHFENFNYGGMPMVFLFRHLLEEGKNLDDAVRIMKDARLTSASNLTLADSEDVLVAELLPGNKRFRKPRRGTLHCTNHYQSQDIRKFIPSITYTSSFIRSRILANQLKKAPYAISPEDVRAMLQSVCIKGINLQSMIFVPARKEIHLAIGSDESARQEFIHLEEKDLFFKNGH